MKKYLFIILMISACSKSQDPSPQTNSVKTDAAIIPYVNMFKGYADARSVSMPAVVLQFGSCDCLKNGVWQVNSSASDLNIEFYVYHALGHAVLNRSETTGSSIMNQAMVSVWKGKEQQYITELFGK